MKIHLCVLSLLALFNCLTPEKSTPSTGSDTLPKTATTGSDQPAKAVSNKQAPANTAIPSAGKWVYEKRVDKSGSTVFKASTTSPQLLNFTFPYAGGSTATLTIRHKNDLTYLYLEVSRGQFNRSFQGGSARIAFDKKPARTYSFTAAENGRANIVFFDAVTALINQMKNARKMRIDVEFYGQGQRQIEFSTANLTWHH